MAWRSSIFGAFRIKGVIPKNFRTLSTSVGITVCAVAGVLAGYHALFTVDPLNAALFIGMMVFMGISLARSGEDTNE